MEGRKQIVEQSPFTSLDLRRDCHAWHKINSLTVDDHMDRSQRDPRHIDEVARVRRALPLPSFERHQRIIQSLARRLLPTAFRN